MTYTNIRCAQKPMGFAFFVVAYFEVNWEKNANLAGSAQKREGRKSD